MTSIHELEPPPGWRPRFRVRAYGAAVLMVVLALLANVAGAAEMTAPGVGEKLAGSTFVLTGVAFAIGVVAIGRRGLRTAARGVDLATSDDGPPALRIRQPRLLGTAAAVQRLRAARFR